MLLNSSTKSDSICSPFGDIQQNETNSCSHTNGIRNPANGNIYSKCLTCTIKNNEIIKQRTCPEVYLCIKLSFDTNTIFEKFFMKYRRIIRNLFINTIHTDFISTLYIDIKSLNLTKINFKYLNTLLKIKHQPYEILNIKFGPSINELKQIKILSDFFETECLGIYIEIVCEIINDDHKNNQMSIKYSIVHNEIKRTGPRTCTKHHSTKSMNPTLVEKMITSTITATMETTEITSSVLTVTTTLIDKTTIIPTISRTILTVTQTISSNLIITSTTSLETTRQNLEKPITTELILITTIKQDTSQRMLTTTEKSTLDTKTTTQTIIFYTTTNTGLFSSSTQSSSPTIFFLFSLLCILFIIIICVVIISIWTLFRHNYLKHFKIDQNSNIMTSKETSTIQSSNTFVSPFIK